MSFWAVRFWDSSSQKMAERYWLPTSGPCLSSWVGSWISKKRRTMAS